MGDELRRVRQRGREGHRGRRSRNHGGRRALRARSVRAAGGRARIQLAPGLGANLGREILLGLEVLIVTDIIRTIVVDQSLQSVGVLGVIVSIRIVLSFALESRSTAAWHGTRGGASWQGVQPERAQPATMQFRAQPPSSGSSASCWANARSSHQQKKEHWFRIQALRHKLHSVRVTALGARRPSLLRHARRMVHSHHGRFRSRHVARPRCRGEMSGRRTSSCASSRRAPGRGRQPPARQELLRPSVRRWSRPPRRPGRRPRRA